MPSIGPFLEACGVHRPLQLRVEYREKPGATPRLFRRPFVLIGRDLKADLRLDHWHVSKCHSYLQAIGGRWFCVDLQSRTGTHWVTGPRRCGWVGRNQAVRIGPFYLRFLDAGDETGLLAELGPSPFDFSSTPLENLPEVSLELRNSVHKRVPRRLNRVLALVGRAPDCHVRLMGGSVSSYTCSLLRTPQGLWLVDLLSREGTYVNGKRVRWARLADGDHIKVGDFELGVISETPWEEDTPGQETEDKASLESGLWTDEADLEVAGNGSISGPADSSFAAGEDVGPASSLVPVPPAPPLAPPPHMLASLPTDQQSLSALLPVLNQFNQLQRQTFEQTYQMSLMQQQMFDQFHQAMLLMMETFHSLNQSQREMIQQELRGIQELTRELHELRSNLAKSGPQGAELGASAPSRAEPPPLKPPTPPRTGGSHPPLGPPPFRELKEPYEKRPAKAIEEEPNGEEAGQTANDTQEALHDELFQRIATLNQARQNRWQKLINFLSGK